MKNHVHVKKGKGMAFPDLPVMPEGENRIVLFYPNIPTTVFSELKKTLSTRWIGQGPKTDEFEQLFKERFCGTHTAIAVGSGTDALHLAYILAGIDEGDEVITPVFTCTATNIPLLYLRAKIVFADIEVETLNIDPSSIENLITERTKALICVHYGGLPCDLKRIHTIANRYNIPVIEDAAQALGATYMDQPIGSISHFTAFSFQAIKHITTGDGGMLSVKDKENVSRARRLRWFGIDHEARQNGTWENDISEVGYKYQMTDIAATMGIVGLKVLNKTLHHRRRLLKEYMDRLKSVDGITVVGEDSNNYEHAAWLCTVLVEERTNLQRKLREHGIESGCVHYRNDRYSIFSQTKSTCPNMDSIEDKYLVLPLHTKMEVEHVSRVCDTIVSGW